MILIQVDCAYPGTDLEPTRVVFEPIGLGRDPMTVGAAFRQLLRQERFEVSMVGGRPLPFISDTIVSVRVWTPRDAEAGGMHSGAPGG